MVPGESNTPTEEQQQEILLAHARDRSLAGTLPPPAITVVKDNPVCGDKISLSVRFDGQRVGEVKIESQGCFICRASAVMLAKAVSGKSRDEAAGIAADFRQLMHGAEVTERLKGGGDLLALGGIRNYPIRIKCALLPFDAAEEILRAVRLKPG